MNFKTWIEAADEIARVAQSAAERAVREQLHLNVIGSNIIGSYIRKTNPKDIDVLVKVANLKDAEGKRIGSTSLEIAGYPIDIFITDGKTTLAGQQVSPQEIKFMRMKKGI